MSAFSVIIPARYGATRLPGKPLALLAGRPIIQHVWERAMDSGAEHVVVATDDQRIKTVVEALGGQAFVTQREHASGTDRLVEVVETKGFEDAQIIVNLQGDEPLMPPALITQVAETLANTPSAAMATLAVPIADSDEIYDPHAVKVIRDHNGRALYFSRAPIPWDRTGQSAKRQSVAMRHLGIYAYRVAFLRRYSELPGSPLETLEQLEQLRALQAGEWIQVASAHTEPGHGIDTPADLLAAEEQIARYQT